MRKLFAATLLSFVFIASDASAACAKCCVPPPFFEYRCCSSICGGTACTSAWNYSSGFYWSSCSQTGEECQENPDYCHNGRRAEELWACRIPANPPRLVAVKFIKHPERAE